MADSGTRGTPLVALLCLVLVLALPVASLAGPLMGLEGAIPGQTNGARVRANSNLNVRATPAGSVLYVQQQGREGTITNGPATASLNGTSIVWWYVTWDVGGPGWVASSTIDVVTTVTAPGAFGITSASPGCTGTSPRIVLTWSASSGATSYDLYRNGSLYASGISGTSFTNEGSNVSPGVTYTYFIRARNSGGTRDTSSMSATAPSNCGATSPPGTFSITSATPQCSGSAPRIVLTWTASSGATSYDVYRNGSLYVSGVAGTTFTNEGSNVAPGTTYAYFIRARNSGGTRDTSTVTATAPSTCGNSTAPGTFAITSVTPGCVGTAVRVFLTWSSSAGASSYDVYRNGSLYVSGVAGTSFSNEGSNVALGTTYSYFIRARNSGGARDTSSVSATTPSSCGGGGRARVSQGVTVTPATVVPGQSFTVGFTLQEVSGTAITFAEIAVAVLNPDGSHRFDLTPLWSNVTVAANGSWSQERSATLFASTPAGQYRAVVRGRVAGGAWFDFETSGSGANPKGFTVATTGVTPAPGAFTLVGAAPECSGTSPRIRLSWTASPNAQTYDVYRNGSVYANGVTETTFLNQGSNVVSGTAYAYFIRARNGVGTRDSGVLVASAPSCGTSGTPVLTVTAPNGNENWNAGTVQTVTWNATGNTTAFNYQFVAYSSDGGANFTNVSSPLPPGARSFQWAIPASAQSTQARVRVRAMDANGYIQAHDQSDANFTIGSGSTQAQSFVGRIVKDLNRNGQHDAGEPFLQTPGVSCPTPGEGVSGLLVGWTGPSNGQTAVNQCNPSPYFSTGPLGVGTYAVQVVIPPGWVSTGPNPRQVTNPGAGQDPWFFLAPVSGSPVIRSVSPNPLVGSNSPQTLDIVGEHFVDRPSVFVNWSGGARVLDVSQVEYVSSVLLRVSITTQIQSDEWGVRVTNPGGRSSATYPFRVLATAAPTLLIDGRTSSSRPQGQAFQYSGSGFSANGIVTRRIRLPNGQEQALASVSASATGAVEWTFTAACGTDTPGTYVISAVDQGSGKAADPVQQIVQPGGTCLPDLTVSALTLSTSSAAPGDRVTVSYTVRNAGGAPAPTSRLALILGSASAASGGTWLTTEVVSPLAPGDTRSGTALITVPVGTVAGAQAVWATADADGSVAQTDRSNDHRSVALTVTNAAGCVVTCRATAPANGRLGDTLTWQAEVQVNSCASPASVSWTFGDGGKASSVTNAYHAYTAAQTYTWTMTATADGTTCTDTGTVTIAAPADGSLRGHVRNASGTAVVAAAIRVRSGETTVKSATSDAQGAWQVANLSPGTYTVEASKAGHVTTEKAVTVGTGSAVDAGVLVLAVTQSAVRITNVRTQYPGKVYLIPGISAPLQYTADIDWGSHPQGTVEFLVGGQSFSATVSGTKASRSIDLAKVAAACQVVTVIATSADGTKSAPYQAPGLVTKTLPATLANLELTPVSLSGRLMFSPSKQFRPRLIAFPTIVIPSSVPLLGSKSFEIGRAEPFLRTEINSDGKGSITGGSTFDFKIAGAAASVELSVFGRGALDTQACSWGWTAGLGFSGDVSFSPKPLPFAIPGVPIPLSLGWRLTASGEGEVVWNLTQPISFGGGVAHVTGDIRGVVTAGVKGALWAEGTAGGKIDVDWRPSLDPRPQVDFQAVGSVEVGALLWSKNWPLESRVFRLFPTEPDADAEDASGRPGWSSLEFVPLSRAYLASPRRGLAPESRPSLEVATEGIKVTALDVAVFPFSDPAISRRDTNANLVYVRDNPARPDDDRTEVALSRWTGQQWTDPLSLSSDATADFSPRVVTFLDGSALTVWEDVKLPVATGTTLAQTWSNLEVSAAFFDAATAAPRPQVRLTNNGVIDRAPRVAGVSRDNAMMTWLTNASTFDEANPLGILGSSAFPTTVWSSSWDGTNWTTPEPLATFDRPILGYDLSYDGAAARVILSLDMDQDLETATDRELFVIAGVTGQWQPPIRLTDDEETDESPQVLNDNGNELLAWVRGDDIVVAPGVAVEQRRVAVSPGAGGQTNDFRVASAPDGRIGLFWLGMSATEPDIFGAYYDPALGVWGQPVKMSTGPGTRERNLAAVFLSSVGLQIVHNSTPESERTFDGSSGLTDFVVLEKTLGVDVGLSAGAITLGAETANGSRPVVVRLENNGELAVQNVVVTLYDGDPASGGTVLGSQTYSDPLAPASSTDVTFSWTPAADRQGNDLHVVVDPDDLLGDRNRANNSSFTSSGRPDLLIETRPIETLSATTYYVTARVSNVGTARSGATEVRFRRGTSQGTLVQAVDVPALGIGESTDIGFIWNTEALTTLPGALAVQVNESGTVVEASTANNSAVIPMECRFSVGTTSLSLRAAQAEQSVAISAGEGCEWSATTSASWLTVVGGGIPGSGTLVVRAQANAAPAARSGEITVAGHVITVTQALNKMEVAPGRLNFTVAARADGTAVLSPGQRVTVAFDGAGVNWTLAASHPWLSADLTTSASAGQITIAATDPGVSVLPAGAVLSATLTITAPSLSAEAFVIPVTITRIHSASAPQGQVDSPAAGASGLQGAIAMTGWAVDDVGIQDVRIYRGCFAFDTPGACQTVAGVPLVFLGQASVVPGARPDVEALYPGLPAANTAGWGLLILSNMLPNVPAENPSGGGVGTFTLYAVATDSEGNQAVLGRSVLDHTPTSVTVANNVIAKPFGAIDTPSPGETVTGTLNNFGWALTPDPGTGVMIPLDGTTIYAFVDGVPVGIATYNLCRGTVGNPVPAGVLCDDDVSAIFRGQGSFRNLDVGRGPIGLRTIDTTTLTNGLHTISWGVSDTGGRIEGIGSRYFSVLNSGGAARSAVSESAAERVVPLAEPRLQARTGFDPTEPFVTLDDAGGVTAVDVDQLGRLEIDAAGLLSVALVVNGEDRQTPVGMAVDPSRGRMTWAPGPAFLGTYRLRLEIQDASGAIRVALLDVRVHAE